MSDSASNNSICPSCGKRFSNNPNHAFQSFCSKRCQIIDLGNWLSDHYRIPLAEQDNEELESALAEAESNKKDEDDT